MYIPNTLHGILLSIIVTTLCSAQDILERQHLVKSSRPFIQDSIFRNPARPQAVDHDTPNIPGPTFSTFDAFTDIPYAGIATFAHLNATNCFSDAADGIFDIGIVGAPFDLGVSYRPGARFGPAGTRMGSRRLAPSMGFRCVY
jgi:agmatinase